MNQYYMDYDIKVHTWWESRIRKVSITSGENKLKIWFSHFGELDLEDKKTQNIFAGIMQGIFGEPVEIPAVNLEVINIKGEKKYSKKVRSKKEFLESFKEAFGDT
jgi:hypothetical protein